MGCTWSSMFSAAILTGAAVSSAHAVDVRSVRVWAVPNNTRVVFDLSGRASHVLKVTRNPDRAELEISGGRLARKVPPMPSIGGAVRDMRFKTRSGQLEVVIDLAHPGRVKSFLAKPSGRYGYRLVIDIGAAAVDPAVVAGLGAGSSGTVRTAKHHTADRTASQRSAEATVGAPIRVAHAPHESRDLVIAIDAGHGGEDPGAIGKNGLREKDVVLAIAQELHARVNAEPGMRAVLTRNGDYFLPLRERMRRARAQSADLFVSVHADSIVDRSIDGSSVYILSRRGATDEASRWLAERENAADLIGGVSLDDKGDLLASVLLDVSQTASLSASQSAADRVLHQLALAGEVRKPQVQQARFMVLKSPDIPSMLVETAYISNLQEEQRLRTQAQRAKIAAAIYRGLRDYFYANPPAGTRIAQLAMVNAPRESSIGVAGGGAGD